MSRLAQYQKTGSHTPHPAQVQVVPQGQVGPPGGPPVEQVQFGSQPQGMIGKLLIISM